jgi:hypothetical protein
MYDICTCGRAFQHFPHDLHNSKSTTYVFSTLVRGSNPTTLIGDKALILQRMALVRNELYDRRTTHVGSHF